MPRIMSYEPIVALKTSSGISYFRLIMGEWYPDEEVVDAFKKFVNSNREQVVDMIGSSESGSIYFDNISAIHVTGSRFDNIVGLIDMEANTNEN